MNVFVFRFFVFFACIFHFFIPMNALCNPEISADDLIYLTENFPPHNFEKDGRLMGASVEILELIWTRMGSSRRKSDIQLVPWARGIKRLENEPNVVLFGMGFSAERIKKFHWVGPYYEHALSLIAKKEKNIRIYKIEDAKEINIGVVREDIGHQMLLNLGFLPARLDLSPDIDSLYHKLAANRFNLICYVEPSFFEYADTQSPDRNIYEPIFQISNMKSGFGFSKNIPETLVKKFQNALDDLKTSSSIDVILKKYHMK